MNAVEVARRRAEELHIAACAEGIDPWIPYDFACAEAERRDIEVARVPKGDVRLHGGRATYDPKTLVILHEDTGSRFLDAFLVAHELGHVELEGRTGFDVAMSPDPGRPAEGAPVGMERVSDYGEKERREVRMDLFAREFLLPRSTVYRLHVVDRLTATQIAERLEADFRVVAVQLLDALLLPPIAPSSTEPKTEKPLNPAQARAAAHRGSPFLLEAGPGTGKTQTLVARVGLLLESGVDPASILILTFSNKAAAELSERIALKWPEAAAVIWVGTFHAFGLDLVRRFHHLLGLPANPRLMDRAEAVELLEEEFPKLDLEHFKNLWDPTRQIADILSAISRAKDEMASPAKYAELAEAMVKTAIDQETQEAARRSVEVATVYREYERLKSAWRCLDFGDLVMVPAALCAADAAVRDTLRARHQHVLVDEFQDVNRASVELLKALTGTGENLWAVGDVRQSLYRFRGASPYNMTLFDQDFPGAERGHLEENYRSSAEIVGAFERFANSGMRASAGGTVTFEARRGPCGQGPQHREVPTGTEVAAVAEAVEEMRAAGFAYRQQAILCAGNERLARLAVGLEASGIPVLYLGSLFERSEIKDLLSLLSLLVDGWGAGLCRAGAMSEFSTSLAELEAVLAGLREGGAGPLEWSHALAGNPSNAGLQAVAALYEGITPGADPWTFLARVLLDRTRIAADIAVADTVDGRFRGIAIWQFMNFVRVQPEGSGPPASRLLDRIRKLVLLAEERDLRQLPEAAQGMDAVRLMTIHGSKGLEFPVVHIPGLNQGSLPRSSGRIFGVAPPDGLVEGAVGTGAQVARDSHEEEQECLFFVALSRARDRLVSYSVTTRSDGKRWAKSPFLDRLGNTVQYLRVNPKGKDPVTADSAGLPTRLYGSISLTDRQVTLYLKCPRRFLYTHLLRTGGRRTETAYMQMHTAVQKVVDWVLEQSVTPSWAVVETRLDMVWVTYGPYDHGYATEFRTIALGLLTNLLALRKDSGTGERKPLRVQVDGGEIIVTPDDVQRSETGIESVRRIWTGHKTYGQEDSVLAALQSLAAQQFNRACRAELVHLGDGMVTTVEMSEQKLENRRRKVEAVIAQIRRGHFPADPENQRDCPRCPSFFICGPVPDGDIDLKKISA
jgi:superfamily I DNA/RNA helicase/Zn-dependent peptidase ImmA (M78 family)